MSKTKYTRNRGLNKPKEFPTVSGWGINDADYKVFVRVGNKSVMCPFYRKWSAMIKRAYSKNTLSKRPVLEGTTVNIVWKYFSAFKSWMETQDWEGLEIDKDILIKGNKEYGPNTCCFVPNYINMLVSSNNKSLVGLPLGVTFVSGYSDRYVARVQGEGKRYLGVFQDPLTAHQAWCMAKAVQIEAAIEKWRLGGETENFSLIVAEKLLDRAADLRLNANKRTEVKSV